MKESCLSFGKEKPPVSNTINYGDDDTTGLIDEICISIFLRYYLSVSYYTYRTMNLKKIKPFYTRLGAGLS